MREAFGDEIVETNKDIEESQNNEYIENNINLILKNESFYKMREKIRAGGVTLECLNRYERLGVDVNDKDFLKCELTEYAKNKYIDEGLSINNDYWLLNLCDESAKMSNIGRAKYINGSGEVGEERFTNIKGIRPVLRIEMD